MLFVFSDFHRLSANRHWERRVGVVAETARGWPHSLSGQAAMSGHTHVISHGSRHHYNANVRKLSGQTRISRKQRFFEVESSAVSTKQKGFTVYGGDSFVVLQCLLCQQQVYVEIVYMHVALISNRLEWFFRNMFQEMRLGFLLNVLSDIMRYLPFITKWLQP